MALRIPARPDKPPDWQTKEDAVHPAILQELAAERVKAMIARSEPHRAGGYPGLVDEVRCFGCGALVPDQSGPAHTYMLSAPGCWALYGSVLAWRNTLAAGVLTTAQRIVDAYAVQHATNPERRNRQSVACHLMSLCASIEHGVSGTRLQTMIGRWTHCDYPLLTPRPAGYPVTIRDVAGAAEQDRPAVVDDWATTTWEAWSAHHDTVRGWLSQAMNSSA